MSHLAVLKFQLDKILAPSLSNFNEFFSFKPLDQSPDGGLWQLKLCSDLAFECCAFLLCKVTKYILILRAQVWLFLDYLAHYA